MDCCQIYYENYFPKKATVKLIDVSYHASYLENTAEEYLARARTNIGYAEHLVKTYEILFVFHTGIKTELIQNGIRYIFRKKTRNNRWLMPWSLNWKLKKEQPDVVLVHSIMYIHFAVLLKLFIGSKSKVYIQNHAEKVPGSWWKRKLIQNLDPYIDGYLFTSKALAAPWLKKRLFSDQSKVFEIMEGSTDFNPEISSDCKKSLGLAQVTTFIWVGRLDVNKDPLCALKALKQYASMGGNFRCYMFYHTEELLPLIQEYIRDNGIEESIILKGYVPKASLEQWYNAADYFISASHYEGSGYALCEAMACNCIPIVTNIPSFRYITDEGKAGMLFERGNWEQLADIFKKTETMNREELLRNVQSVFNNRLSYGAIANDMHQIFSSEK